MNGHRACFLASQQVSGKLWVTKSKDRDSGTLSPPGAHLLRSLALAGVKFNSYPSVSQLPLGIRTSCVWSPEQRTSEDRQFETVIRKSWGGYCGELVRS